MTLKDLTTKHPYYCRGTQDYTESFDNFEDFLSEWGDADVDMNLLVRFDLTANEGGTGYELRLYFLQQRLGKITQVIIEKITEKDVPAITEFLTYRKNYLNTLWFPL